MEHQKEAIILLREDINRLDDKVESLRAEILTLTRWNAGLLISNVTMLLGWILKSVGAF